MREANLYERIYRGATMDTNAIAAKLDYLREAERNAIAAASEAYNNREGAEVVRRLDYLAYVIRCEISKAVKGASNDTAGSVTGSCKLLGPKAEVRELRYKGRNLCTIGEESEFFHFLPFPLLFSLAGFKTNK